MLYRGPVRPQIQTRENYAVTLQTVQSVHGQSKHGATAASISTEVFALRIKSSVFGSNPGLLPASA